MKKITAIAIAALLSVSAPVMAQTSPTLAPATSDPALPTESNADFGIFMQGFGSADFTSASDALDSASSVSVVKLSGMANVDATAFNEALVTREDDVVSLRTKVAANAKAKAALDAAGLTVDDVIAIEASNDGAITLYVNDL